MLEPADGQAVAAARPGQFVVLRLGPASAPALMRSYSLSGEPDAPSYRVSVKRETHGSGQRLRRRRTAVGDIVPASAARGSFTLRPGDTPVILLSAGIGVTPVLAMLHALAAKTSTREVWWLYGTRNGREHPFAERGARAARGPSPPSQPHLLQRARSPPTGPTSISTARGRLDPRLLERSSICRATAISTSADRPPS